MLWGSAGAAERLARGAALHERAGCRNTETAAAQRVAHAHGRGRSPPLLPSCSICGCGMHCPTAAEAQAPRVTWVAGFRKNGTLVLTAGPAAWREPRGRGKAARTLPPTSWLPGSHAQHAGTAQLGSLACFQLGCLTRGPRLRCGRWVLTLPALP